jgi:hypothetical protein
MLGPDSTSTLLDGSRFGRDVTRPLYVGDFRPLPASEPT